MGDQADGETGADSEDGRFVIDPRFYHTGALKLGTYAALRSAGRDGRHNRPPSVTDERTVDMPDHNSSFPGGAG